MSVKTERIKTDTRIQYRTCAMVQYILIIIADENMKIGQIDLAKDSGPFEVTVDMVDPSVVDLVPFDMASQYQLIPIRIEGNSLWVAMVQPMDLPVRDMLQLKTGYEIVPLCSPARAIQHCLSHFYSPKEVARQDIASMRLTEGSDSTPHSKNLNVRSGVDKEAPIVRIVDMIITGAIDIHASDIHIEPDQNNVRVRYRVNGVLQEVLDVPLSAQEKIVSHIKVLAGMDIIERRFPQDGYLHYLHQSKPYDVRISSMPSVRGEKIVMRILDPCSGLTEVQQSIIALPEFQWIKRLIHNPYGMVLFTGPTGSGKTSTLYALLQILNTPERNIVTVEDPVEYRFQGITQAQVVPEIEMTFPKYLRSILRQDPDVILVGEIRDHETAEIAVSAAQTGHLVLSTLHTNDASGAITRLVNLGIPSFQLGSALLGIVAQRLVRSLCPSCKQPYQIGPGELSKIEDEYSAEIKQLLGQSIFRAYGCHECRNTGYSKRQALYEILEISPSLRNAITDEISESQIREMAIKEGMKTLQMQGIEKLLQGHFGVDELLRVVNMREC